MSDSPFADELSALLGPVKPLAQNDKVLHPRQPAELAAATARRSAAAAEAAGENLTDYLSDERIELLDPYALLSFCRAGVQHGVWRKLRLGQYALEAKLDLHQLTLRQARQAIIAFINDCQRRELRSVSIIHGLGLRAQPPALMKSHVHHWLQQIDAVMAFHSCQPHDGGYGAVYLLLRKGSQAKALNRERHQRRRG